MLDNFYDIAFTYRVMALLVSVAMFAACLEELVSFAIFQPRNLLAWQVARLSYPSFSKRWIRRGIDFLLSDAVFRISVYCRLLLSLGLFIGAWLGLFSALGWFCLFILHCLVFLRSPYGLDGAYQMQLMLSLALFIGNVSGIHSFTGELSLGFIALQLILCYFISGFTKVCSPVWREAYAIHAIFSTRTYGHHLIYNLAVRFPFFAYTAAWFVMLFELLFILCLVMPLKVCFFFLGLGVLFHLSNAIFMGLNNFLFAFVAAYPALIYFLLPR